jgi:hypothetical protein
MRNSSQTPHIWMLTLASVGFLGIPEAPVYQLSVLSGAIAAILSTANFRIEKHWKWTTCSLLVAVVVSSVPFNFYSNSDTRLGSFTSSVPSIVFRSDQWLIPFCWLATFSIAIIAIVKKRNVDTRRGASEFV